MTPEKFNLQPLGDRVVVLPDQIGEEIHSGIVVPPTNKEGMSGVVVAVGEGKRLDDGKLYPINVAVGDRVLLGQYGRDEVTFEGKKYFIAATDSLLAVLKN